MGRRGSQGRAGAGGREEKDRLPQLLAGWALLGELLVFSPWQQRGSWVWLASLECLCWDGQATPQRGEGGKARFSRLFLLLPAALWAYAALPIALQASGCLQGSCIEGGPSHQPLKATVSALGLFG